MGIRLDKLSGNYKKNRAEIHAPLSCILNADFVVCSHSLPAALAPEQ